MKTTTKIAFACFFLTSVLEALIGFRYIFATQIMPYHEVAIGASWSDLSPGIQLLFVMLIKSVGAGNIIILSAINVLLFIPFRKGEPWSRWLLFAMTLFHSLFIFWIILTVKLSTQACPPLWVPIAGGILSIAGFLLSTGMAKEKE